MSTSEINYKSARFLRLLAITVDFYAMIILIFAALPLYFFLPAAVKSFALFFGAMLWVCGVYCRDYLWSGRSLGKRLFGLSVVDRATGAPATGKQLIAKNLFTFLASIDGPVLLFSGKSIAERVTGTAVVRSKVSTPLSGKRFLKVIAVAAVLALLLYGVVSIGLNAAKQNESYAVACAYLTESDTFRAQEDSDDFILTSYSASTNASGQTQSYDFETTSHLYTVVCHLGEDGTWTVCTECTEFE